MSESTIKGEISTPPDLRALKYLEKARALGMDVEREGPLHWLMQAIRLVEARMKCPQRRKDRQYMAEKLGCTEDDIRRITAMGYINVAEKIVMDLMLEEMVESDLKTKFLDVYQQGYLTWLTNMSRIASSRPGMNGKPPRDTDAVAAYIALREDRIGQAFTSMTFLDKEGENDEKRYLSAQRALAEKTEVIDLDTSPPAS